MKHTEIAPEQIQSVADAGRDIANEANKAFDNKVAARTDQAAIERVSGIPGVSITDEAYEAVEKRGDDEYDRFHRLVGIAGDLIGRNALGEKAFSSNDQAEPETIKIDQLSAEQREKAAKLNIAMAEKFGVSAEDFSVLKTTAEDGSGRFTVAYTVGNGLDMGNSKKDYDAKRSCNGLFDKKADKDFMIEVDGQKIDTRTGMTEAAYAAFIADAKASNVDPLPDSQELANKNGKPWTATWLTGEEADRISARVAYVDDGQVFAGWDFRDDGYRDVRFRPAVVIE